MTTPVPPTDHAVSPGVVPPQRPERLHVILPLLVDTMPGLLDDVARLLRPSYPEYGAFLEEHADEVSAGGAIALARVVELAGSGGQLPAPARDQDDDTDGNDVVTTLFNEIGRAQFRYGNPLTRLLSAYQTGARAAWHHISAIAIERRVPAGDVALLADALFGFVDQLSSASADGYLAEQNEAVAGRVRARAMLADLLLSEHASMRGLEEAARRAGWPLPQTAAVVLLDPEAPVSEDVLHRADGAGWLPMNQSLVMGFIVGDLELAGRRRRLLDLLAGSPAVIGPSVPLTQLAASVPLARVTQRLRRAEVVTDDPVFLTDHLDAILVHQDESLLQALERQVLAPLAALPEANRLRLEETLASWLRHIGDRQAMADELHIHRQTVRYRMSQLHELFGDQLSDPAKRLSLLLALGWRAPQRHVD